MNRNCKTSKDKRTNYIYYGANGNKTILIPGADGVTEAIIETLHTLDDLEFDKNRKETRRHKTLDDFNDKAEMVIDQGVDVEEDALSNLDSEVAKTLIHKAVSMLKPQQRALICALYLSNPPMSQAEYANTLGIAESSVQQNARRARAKLKEIIENLNQ